MHVPCTLRARFVHVAGKRPENDFQESAIPQTLPSAWKMAFRESALRTCTERATSIMTFRKVPFPKLSLAPGNLLFGKVLSPQLFLRLGNDFRDSAMRLNEWKNDFSQNASILFRSSNSLERVHE